MIIRTIHKDDVPEVKSLIDSNFAKHIDSDSLDRTIDSESDKTYILISDSGIILSTVGIRDKCRLVWACSREKRQGHARRLLNHVLSVTSGNLYLYVKQYNQAAIELYKRLGFVINGTRDQSFRMELNRDENN